MSRWLVALAATVFAASALAAPPTSRPLTLVTGKAITAEVFAQPDAGTVEEALAATLSQVIAGDFQGFMANRCDASACGDERQREQMLTYNLPAAQRTAGQCFANNELVITKRKTNETGDLTLYLWCGASRMPAPSTWKQVDGAWKTTSFSW